MCDPFGLDCALAPFVGNNTAAAGAIIGMITTVVIWVCLEIMFSATRKHGAASQSESATMISAMIGFLFSVMMGWFALWIPFLIFLVLAWFLIDPMGSRKGSANG